MLNIKLKKERSKPSIEMWHVLVIHVLCVLVLLLFVQIQSKDAPFSLKFRRCAVNRCPLEYSKLRNSLSTVTYRDYLKECARYNCGIRRKKFYEMKKRKELYGSTCLRLNCVRPALQHEVSFHELRRCVSRDFKCKSTLMREMAKRYNDHQLADSIR